MQSVTLGFSLGDFHSRGNIGVVRHWLNAIGNNYHEVTLESWGGLGKARSLW